MFERIIHVKLLITESLQISGTFFRGKNGNLTGCLSGALLVQEAALLYGRPITLAGGPDGGWIDRATADALFALAATPGQVMTLTGLPQQAPLAVIFDRSQGPAIEAQMVMRYAYPDAGTWYTCQLRLLTVAPA